MLKQTGHWKIFPGRAIVVGPDQAGFALDTAVTEDGRLRLFGGRLAQRDHAIDPGDGGEGLYAIRVFGDIFIGDQDPEFPFRAGRGDDLVLPGGGVALVRQDYWTGVITTGLPLGKASNINEPFFAVAVTLWESCSI